MTIPSFLPTIDTSTPASNEPPQLVRRGAAFSNSDSYVPPAVPGFDPFSPQNGTLQGSGDVSFSRACAPASEATFALDGGNVQLAGSDHATFTSVSQPISAGGTESRIGGGGSLTRAPWEDYASLAHTGRAPVTSGGTESRVVTAAQPDLHDVFRPQP